MPAPRSRRERGRSATSNSRSSGLSASASIRRSSKGSLGTSARHDGHRPTFWQGLAKEILDGPVALRLDPGHDLRGLGRVSPSASNASRTSAERPDRRSRSAPSPPSLSAKVEHARCATFLPTPGTTVEGVGVPGHDRASQRVGLRADRNASRTSARRRSPGEKIEQLAFVG